MTRGWPLLVLLAACSGPQDPKPALIVSTSAAELDAESGDVTVEIKDAAGTELFSRQYAHDDVPNGSTMAVFQQRATGDDPKPGNLFPGTVITPGTSLRITITTSGEQKVVRGALVSLPSSDVKLLAMPLQRACVGVACEVGQTCNSGACVPLAVDSSQLPQATGYLP